MSNTWQARSYDEDFGFVTALGRELVADLAVRPGDRVLDVGCGTGHLTAQCASAGASTVGLDADEDMISRARATYPALTWVLGDAQEMPRLDLPRRPFDAVVSNAALHWMPRQSDVLAGIRSVVRPGARFVAEMGGAGNVAAADRAFRTALAECDVAVQPPRNFFPSVAEQAALLEGARFRVDTMRWFQRPTPLAAGQTLVHWLRHFRADTWAAIPADRVDGVSERVLSEGARLGLSTGGSWHVDYCRLRFSATAVDSA